MLRYIAPSLSSNHNHVAVRSIQIIESRYKTYNIQPCSQPTCWIKLYYNIMGSRGSHVLLGVEGTIDITISFRRIRVYLHTPLLSLLPLSFRTAVAGFALRSSVLYMRYILVQSIYKLIIDYIFHIVGIRYTAKNFEIVVYFINFYSRTYNIKIGTKNLQIRNRCYYSNRM